MVAVTVTKKLVAGVPVQLIATGASEEGSLAIQTFAPKGPVKLDLKFLAPGYVIGQDRYDATNFTRTLHPGGTLDLTQPYVQETIGGTAYNHMFTLSGMTARLRDNTTNLFGATVSVFAAPAHLRDADVARSRVLLSYGTAGNTLTLKNGAPNKFTDVSALTTVLSRSFTYYLSGMYAGDAGGFAIGCSVQGYTSHSINLSSSSTAFDWTTDANGYSAIFITTAGGSVPTQARLIGFGNYIFIASPSGNGDGKVYFHAAPISGFVAGIGNAPGWALKSTITLAATDVYITNMSQVAADFTVEMGGTAFFLFATISPALNNQTLVKAVLNGTTGAVTGTAKVTNNIDGNFKPFRIGTQTVYRKTDQSYILVDSSGTVTPYVFATLARPFAAKTLAVNYASYVKYKAADGMAATDGLAYYTDGTGSYNTNGQSFWCAEGKYTLVRDNFLKSLAPVGTDDDWFDQQNQLPSGARTNYPGVTLKSNLSIWAVSDRDAQIVITGYKE